MRNDIYASFQKLYPTTSRVAQLLRRLPHATQWPSRPPSA